MSYLIEVKKTENLRNIWTIQDKNNIKIQWQSYEQQKNNTVLQMIRIWSWHEPVQQEIQMCKEMKRTQPTTQDVPSRIQEYMKNTQEPKTK